MTCSQRPASSCTRCHGKPMTSTRRHSASRCLRMTLCATAWPSAVSAIWRPERSTYPSVVSRSSISETEGADFPKRSAIRACMTGAPSSVRVSIVCRYSSRGGWCSTVPPLELLMDLLGQVMVFAKILDERQLDLEPVRVLLFALQDLVEELATPVVPPVDTQGDAPVEALDRRPLELERQVELLVADSRPFGCSRDAARSDGRPGTECARSTRRHLSSHRSTRPGSGGPVGRSPSCRTSWRRGSTGSRRSVPP